MSDIEWVSEEHELFGNKAVVTVSWDRNTGDFDVNWDGLSQVEAIGILTLALREAEMPIYDDSEEET